MVRCREVFLREVEEYLANWGKDREKDQTRNLGIAILNQMVANGKNYYYITELVKLCREKD